MNKQSLFFSTNAQKILAFFLERPNSEFYDAQVSEKTGISRAGANIALRTLHDYKYLIREKRGRMRFYKLAKDNYLIRQYRVLHTLEKLQGLMNKIKPLAKKAVLFGSTAKGVSNEESDIDILVVTREKDNISKIFTQSDFAEKLQCIIKTPVEMIELKNSNKELTASIDEGIVLWEGTTD